MALVPAKCTQCGGNIEVDNTHEAGICKFCGTPFVTEKAINNYNTFVTNNFAGATINVLGANEENLLVLARRANDSSNTEEAFHYYKKVCELNPNNLEATFYNELFSGLYNDIFRANAQNICNYAKNWNDSLTSENRETTKEICNMLFSFAQTLYNASVKKVTSNINLFFNATKNSTQIYGLAYELLLEVDEEKAVEYLNGILKNLSIAKIMLNSKRTEDSSANRMISEISDIEQKYLSEMKKYNSDYDIAKSDTDVAALKKLDENLSNNKNSGGCYIATCVYGSYDCPQVWTLRRYRDYTLDETWYGRLFIKCYYAVSPKLVKWFGNYAWFRKPWKKFLDGMVERLNSEGVADTKYSDKY